MVNTVERRADDNEPLVGSGIQDYGRPLRSPHLHSRLFWCPEKGQLRPQLH